MLLGTNYLSYDKQGTTSSDDLTYARQQNQYC